MVYVSHECLWAERTDIYHNWYLQHVSKYQNKAIESQLNSMVIYAGTYHGHPKQNGLGDTYQALFA